MRLARQVRLSVAALLAHRLRTTLALGTIGVGVASVLTTGAIGVGAQRDVVGRIQAMGTNLLIVRPVQVRRFVGRPAVRGLAASLLPGDAAAIGASPLVSGAAPAAEVGAKVTVGAVTTLATVRGTSPSYATVRRLRLEAGRFFDADDDRDARRVAVLGSRTARTLFAGANAVGRDVRVRGVPFEVVGVLVPRGVLADGSDEDNHVLVPLRTAMRRLLNVTWLNAVFVGVERDSGMSAAAGEIRRLLRERHGTGTDPVGDDFEVQDTARYLDMQRRAASSLERLAIGLGVLTLVMAGAGIFALMLLSVKERTSEIGLRMAIGARPRQVFAQFVVEAILLALSGWLAGVAAAALGAGAVALGTSWPVGLPVPVLLGSLGMCLAVGIGAGALPARKASLVPPIGAILSR
jgi:putative ABC transport system permease protein